MTQNRTQQARDFSSRIISKLGQNAQYCISETWIKYGGDFVRSLGLTLAKASGADVKIIYDSFHHYIIAYRGNILRLVEEMKAEADKLGIENTDKVAGIIKENQKKRMEADNMGKWTK